MARPIRRLLLPALFVLLLASTLPAGRAFAQDSWQTHLAQANNFYRNKLLPKALEELKLVVADAEGAKQLKAWQLIIDIASKMKDLDNLMWALEKGREVAEGQDAAQMQAQLYRLKRMYGRVVFQAAGGSGKLPEKGLKIKNKEEIGDPEAKAYYEKARVEFGEKGYSRGSYYLPAGTYDLEGDELKIAAGKDTVVEVAPTTDVDFAVDVAGGGGYRGGDVTTGASGFLGGLRVGLGPHVQFSSGNSLMIRVGPALLFGAQATTDVQQDTYQRDNRARVAVGGFASVGFEFRIGKIDLGPHAGFAVQSLPSGMYYRGRVVSSPEGTAPGVLDGEFIVPAVAYGPRLGLDVMLTPALVKSKRVPRLFVGIEGGPLWAKPLWGEVLAGSSVGVVDTETRGGSEATADALKDGPFVVDSIGAGLDAGKARAFGDIQALFGVQLRL